MAHVSGDSVPEWDRRTQILTQSISPESIIKDNVPVTFYRRNLPHWQRDCKPHFFTFRTTDRWVSPNLARDIVLEAAVTGTARGITCTRLL